jgi:hypothetical protein
MVELLVGNSKCTETASGKFLDISLKLAPTSPKPTGELHKDLWLPEAKMNKRDPTSLRVVNPEVCMDNVQFACA